MATSAKTSVVTKTKALITSIFSDGKGWLVAAPTSEEAATVAPSSTSSMHFVGSGVPSHIRFMLKDELLAIMSQYILNDVHLESVVGGIIYDLSAPLVSYRNAPNETCVREAVVLPLLRTIFERALPLLAEGKTESYAVRIIPEDPVSLRDGRGRRPAVDYVVCLDDESGAPLCLLLVEVKKQQPSERQLPQLSAYASKVSTCPLYSNRVLVSLFLTQSHFSIGFSALVDTEGYALPTTYFTPQISWRDEKQQLDVHSEAILLLSILHALKVKRWCVKHPEPILREVSRMMYLTPFSPPAPTSVAGQTLSDVVQDLRRKDEEIAAMRKELEKAVLDLSGVKDEVLGVKDQVDALVMMTPPRPPAAKRAKVQAED